ncbi:MAG TPA: M23 family metallopeptidase [Anaerolineales bacterium]|nr:M23 family metallopeptidase [Anaerolineales bacterium]
MINTISQIPSAYGLSAANTSTTTAASSTSDTLSSFKDILSTMMTVSSGMSGGQQVDSSLNDLMSPLLMIILLEKLVEGQMEEDVSASSLLGTSASKAEPSGRPVGGVLTQEYHPGHNGLDFGVVVGTPVETTMDGKVIYAGWNDQGYGNLVIVENGEYRTYYAHLSSIPVSVGEAVTAGSTIGLSGNTGNSTGPHLHYEIRRNKIPIDPTSATLG